MNEEARKIIAQLGLEPLPLEGGWFRRTRVSAVTLDDGRSAESAIYFLVTAADFSAFHRLKIDEVWYFHAGDALEHVILDPRDGSMRVTRLGPAVCAGEVPQLAVARGVWQGARLAAGSTVGWTLLSCTTSPAWEDTDFELGQRDELKNAFPAARDQIDRLTR